MTWSENHDGRGFDPRHLHHFNFTLFPHLILFIVLENKKNEIYNQAESKKNETYNQTIAISY